MKLLFLILLAAAILVILLFLFALRIKLVLDTDKSEITMTVLWLDPLIKAYVTSENAIPMLKVYVFHQLIFQRALNKALNKGRNKRGGTELVKLSRPKDVNVNVRYGFSDPFTTGVACGAINVASQFINIDSINQTPDFLSTDDYIYLDATAKVNLGSTLIRLFKSKTSS